MSDETKTKTAASETGYLVAYMINKDGNVFNGCKTLKVQWTSSSPSDGIERYRLFYVELCKTLNTQPSELVVCNIMDLDELMKVKPKA